MISERERVKGQINDCLNYISALEKGFNEAVDENLIDYYIYETKAAEERYKYLSGIYSKMTL